MRFLAVVLVFLAGCSTTIGESPKGTADARPIDFRDPPEPKEGSGTSPGCEGVTARGECQQGTAVYCDLERGRLRRVDCEALGQNCILDIARGAICQSLDEQDTGEGSGAASACTDTGISETGFCTTAGSAVYCDTAGAQPVTKTWDCTAAGMTCGVGDCATGAYCCGGTSQPPAGQCGTLDFNGICDNGTAKWCDPVTGPKEKNCTAAGQRCESDTCATGAYCCGTVGGGPAVDECAQIGYAGVCSTDKNVRFCFQDEILNATCSGNKTCQVDACMPGAGCCAPPTAPPVNECTTIGIAGVCPDANTVRFCLGTTAADIYEFSCTGGQSCQVNVCGNGAYCCDEVDPCANLDAVGVCEGNTLKYCTNGTLHESNCSTSGQTCEEDTCFPGFAECCN